MINSTDPIAPRTIKEEIDLFKEFIRRLEKKGIILVSDYLDDIKVKAQNENEKIIEPTTIENQTHLLAYLNDLEDPWLHDVTLCLLVTGCRSQDLQNLKQSMIKDDQIEFNVQDDQYLFAHQ